MNRMTLITIAAALLSLTACGPEAKDYEASANCQNMGKKPGTAEYDKCLREEKSVKMMEQQRRDFEQMQQQQLDDKMRRY
jgi:hypothetical protein